MNKFTIVIDQEISARQLERIIVSALYSRARNNARSLSIRQLIDNHKDEFHSYIDKFLHGFVPEVHIEGG